LTKGKPHHASVEFPATLLKAGNNRIAIVTTQGSWFLYDRVALETPAGVEAAAVSNASKLVRPLAPKPVQVEQVIVVFKTHFDVGYTDMASNIVARYRTTMIDKALEVVDKNRDLPPAQQFAWTVPGWPMHQILDWPQQTPERKQRVESALQAGRFAVHALPFTLHTETLELEDLVRGLGHSSRIARRLGLPLPRDAKMTDVPCHAWVMPTLLKRAGVDFLHIGCNSGCSSPRLPTLFWWEGPDGSRLLTYYNATGYGSGLMPPRDWPHKTWLALIHSGDNHGPPTPDEVKRLLDQAAKRIARREDPHWPALGFCRRDPRRETEIACGARRHAGHVDSRADVRSGWRSHRAQHAPHHRHHRGARHVAARVGRGRAGCRGDNRGGLRKQPALRRAHVGWRALLDHAL
jgi:hypothetical protein